MQVVQVEMDKCLQERNAKSKSIGKLKASGQDVSEVSAGKKMHIHNQKTSSYLSARSTDTFTTTCCWVLAASTSGTCASEDRDKPSHLHDCIAEKATSADLIHA